MSGRQAGVGTARFAHRDETCHDATKGDTIRHDATTMAMPDTMTHHHLVSGRSSHREHASSMCGYLDVGHGCRACHDAGISATGRSFNVQECLSCDALGCPEGSSTPNTWFQNHSLVPPCGGRFLRDAPGELVLISYHGRRPTLERETGLNPDRGNL